MFQLVQPATAEQVIKKSRFLATAVPIANEHEAKAALAAHGHVDANHNCWAWRIGAGYRFSDDGEPSGTAGKPILAAIDGQAIDKVVVIVTRWFGGILLGSGGLVRAYGGTAAICLRGAERIEMKPSVDGYFHLEFSDLALVKAKLTAFKDLQILEERFGATGADIAARIVETDVEAVSRLVADLTSGRSDVSFD
ncbi:YigZ family protein [Rhizobium sp. TH2]|uniref:IMPACT family protein n=1 Tax=Rhizobium sp. TH2 TaxID=2775403 RepID=UPI002157753A|nr:YigZ family protein [Rhizobium sp. TH2]UVC09014.1 YigZ family protein [Rhizobium sp. TH2]